ncbi:F-box/LRR-repeat protein At3g03360 [Rosa chinensis]|nr:F-box/LRR-repeat protein At3g03360 [Rosa chinensis]
MDFPFHRFQSKLISLNPKLINRHLLQYHVPPHRRDVGGWRPYLMKKRVRQPTSQFVKDENDCKLRNRKQNNAGNKLVDRISVLPDEILVSILSLLPLKEAQATSVLSKRWRRVWASIITLNFDCAPTISSFIWSYISSKSYNLKSEVEAEISRFVPWINSVVEQHNVPCIEHFRVCSHLNQEFASSIDKWVQFAMEKGVRTLELDFSVWGCVPPMYTFPHYLLKHLCDDHIPIQGPCACIGLKSLKVLNFNCVNVAGEVLEYFLSNCTVLEQLLVCESPSLIDLRVVGSSVALKYLLVQDCSNIKSIEIYDAKLISFIYKGEPESI